MKTASKRAKAAAFCLAASCAFACAGAQILEIWADYNAVETLRGGTHTWAIAGGRFTCDILTAGADSLTAEAAGGLPEGATLSTTGRGGVWTLVLDTGGAANADSLELAIAAQGEGEAAHARLQISFGPQILLADGRYEVFGGTATQPMRIDGETIFATSGDNPSFGSGSINGDGVLTLTDGTYKFSGGLGEPSALRGFTGELRLASGAEATFPNTLDDFTGTLALASDGQDMTLANASFACGALDLGAGRTLALANTVLRADALRGSGAIAASGSETRIECASPEAFGGEIRVDSGTLCVTPGLEKFAKVGKNGKLRIMLDAKRTALGYTTAQGLAVAKGGSVAFLPHGSETWQSATADAAGAYTFRGTAKSFSAWLASGAAQTEDALKIARGETVATGKGDALAVGGGVFIQGALVLERKLCGDATLDEGASIFFGPHGEIAGNIEGVATGTIAPDGTAVITNLVAAPFAAPAGRSLRIASGGMDVTSAFAISLSGGFATLALDPEGEAAGVRVRPVLSQACAMQALRQALGGETPAFEIDTIPGLKYTAECSTQPNAGDAEWSRGETILGNGGKAILTAPRAAGEGAPRAFYRISVSL